MSVSPNGLTLQQWAAALTLQLDRYETLPTLQNTDDWRTWAAAVCNAPTIRKSNPPNPYEFDNWRAWAARFNSVFVY